MDLILRRFAYLPNITLGLLYLPEGTVCTAEPAWRGDDMDQHGCLPLGNYDAERAVGQDGERIVVWEGDRGLTLVPCDGRELNGDEIQVGLMIGDGYAGLEMGDAAMASVMRHFRGHGSLHIAMYNPDASRYLK